MKIDIICVGRLKKDFISIDRIYRERIKKMSELSISELKEKDICSESLDIIKKLRKDHYRVIFSPDGKKDISHDFFGKLLSSHSKIQFIIGGAEGVNEKVFTECDTTVSISPLIFPHQLFRVMLIEQIYRGMCIINNHPYHKV